jgi:hypothetical protein
VVTPVCPTCSAPPALVISGQQAFCQTPGCPTFIWDPTKTLDELMADISFVDLRREEDR